MGVRNRVPEGDSLRPRMVRFHPPHIPTEGGEGYAIAQDMAKGRCIMASHLTLTPKAGFRAYMALGLPSVAARQAEIRAAGNKSAQFDAYCGMFRNDTERVVGVQVVKSEGRLARLLKGKDKPAKQEKADGRLAKGTRVAYERKSDGNVSVFQVTGYGKSKRHGKPGTELTNVESGFAKVWNDNTIAIYLAEGRLEVL